MKARMAERRFGTCIVEAARAALAESHHVHLNEIAKCAGIG
ncbi:hypothetical protein ACGFWE_00460 [Streptomyces sp. NPDC048523]